MRVLYINPISASPSLHIQALETMAGGRWPFRKGKNELAPLAAFQRRRWLASVHRYSCPTRLGVRAHPDGSERATSPCHGPMPTSRRGGFSIAGACRFLLFPAKVRSVFRRSCGGAPCSRLTCGVTRRSPSRHRPGTRSGPRNGERTGALGIWATATGTSARPRRPPTTAAGTMGTWETEAATTGTSTMATTTTVCLYFFFLFKML
jgi:hypothetical protein